MKKLLSYLLAFILIVSVVPFGAFTLTASAAMEHYYGNYTYIINDEGAIITEFDTSIGGKVIIPNTFNYTTVVGIDSSAFKDCTYITSVIFNDHIKSIGSDAFRGCTSLSSVTLGNSVTNIGAYAFYNCTSLTSINIPNSVTSIGGYAFYNCTKLADITIPDSVTSIGGSAFIGTVPYNNIDNWHDDVLYIEDNLIECKTSKSGAYTIKDNTKIIAGRAFYNCSNLTGVTIPNSVESICSDAFEKCTGLTNITIPDSVKIIDNYAFYNCTGLIAVTIGDGVESIGKWAFEKCTSLTNIVIPNSVKSIGIGAFSNCTGLISVTIGDGVESIGGGSFKKCTGLTNITIPDSVKSIDSYAFENCTGLISATIGDGVISINAGAFYNCTNIESITLPFIGGSAKENQHLGYIFGGVYSNDNSYVPSSLKTVVISDKCESIAANSFSDCTGLESVIIGNGVKNIDEYAFSGCTGLKNIVIPDSVTRIHDYVLYGCNSLESITLPFVGSSDYLNGSSYDFLGYIFGRDKSASSGSTKQGGYYFYIPDSLKSVTITNATAIGEAAFENCSNLTSITINDGITSIGKYAFYNCGGLANITIPNSVTNIGYQAFYGCNNLENLTVPFVGSSREVNKTYDSVLGYFFGHEGTSNRNGTIKQQYGTSSTLYYYYYMPSSLKNVTITDATHIPYGAFYNCENLTNITINDGVSSIGDRAFYQCKGITEIVIPDKVTSIGMATFSGCTSLESVSFSDKVTSIGDSAFDYRCESLTDVWYSGTVDDRENISVDTFYNANLINATWHYETCKDKSTHTYDNSCDAECNVCNHIRTLLVHVYDNDCDTACNNCDYTRDVTHAYGDWITKLEPTCVSSGLKLKICGICGDTVTESINATGVHSYNAVVTEATCTEQGYTTHTCSECGNSFVNSYIDAIGHIYDDDFDAFCNECNTERVAKERGDTDGDGQINNRDLVLLIRYINGWEVETDEKAADVNNDGKINNKDYVLLMRRLNALGN